MGDEADADMERMQEIADTGGRRESDLYDTGVTDEEYDAAEDADWCEPETPAPSRRERLRAEARPSELLLWIDLETIGTHDKPNPEYDTVLEASWFISYRQVPDGMRGRGDLHRRYGGILRDSQIDLSDWQLTPLRSRLCAIGSGEGVFPHAQVPADDMRWHDNSAVPANVVKMHEDSGLTQEHIDAQADGRVLDSADQLDRMVADDLGWAAAQWRAKVKPPTEPGRVSWPTIYIAGDGVGHYDQPLLQRGQFHRMAKRWHYRPEDISHAVHLFAPVRHPAELLFTSRAATAWGETLAEGLRVDPLADVAGGITPEVITDWFAAEEIPHRAAADVVRAALAYLVAREAVGSTLTDRLY